MVQEQIRVEFRKRNEPELQIGCNASFAFRYTVAVLEHALAATGHYGARFQVSV